MQACLAAARGTALDHPLQRQLHEALQQLGTVHDTLFHTRDELGRLRTENAQLRQALATHPRVR